MSKRTCPVNACGRALGTTRQGDPYALCGVHYMKLDNSRRIRLWRAYRGWQRVERAYLKAKAEGLGDLKPHMDARAEAIKHYITIRNDCIEYAGRAEGDQLELAQ